jgi:seryl-tRNA synthetase
LLWCGGTAHAQSERVNAVIGEQVKTEEAARASQKRVAQLDEEAGRMLAEYRQMTAEAQSLKTYNEQLGTQVASQQQQLTTMTQQLGEIEVTSREVQPMMTKMLTTLEQFVKFDLPFLPEERANRIAQLKETLARADVSISEKYRRLVEAYQIEMEYGRTLEAYQGKVDDKTVDFLRAGRVALLYQTLDGRETGYWDADTKKWKVDNEFADAIETGLKVAKKQSAPDFVTVPVHAPKAVSP